MERIPSFNPVVYDEVGDGIGWVSRYHFGINEGPTILMIENHRSELIWRLMKECVALRTGLKAAGFSRGWLDVSGGAKRDGKLGRDR